MALYQPWHPDVHRVLWYPSGAGCALFSYPVPHSGCSQHLRAAGKLLPESGGLLAPGNHLLCLPNLLGHRVHSFSSIPSVPSLLQGLQTCLSFPSTGIWAREALQSHLLSRGLLAAPQDFLPPKTDFPCHKRASSWQRCCSGKVLGGSSGFLPSGTGSGWSRVSVARRARVPLFFSLPSWLLASGTLASMRSWRPRYPHRTVPSLWPAVICKSGTWVCWEEEEEEELECMVCALSLSPCCHCP